MEHLTNFLVTTLTTNPLLFWISFAILLILCGLAGFLLNCKLNQNFEMESLIIFLSVAIFLATLIGCIATDNSTIMTVLLNFFTTIIFSWLLTKKSSKKEFKETQAELARRSYRYMNTIESATITASKMIETSGQASSEALVGKLSVAINTIQTSIKSCKMDWYDMLSETDKDTYKEKISDETPNPDISNMNVAGNADKNPAADCDEERIINQEHA